MAIIKCRCEHEYQDKKYGPGNRVHTWAPAANSKNGGWRCTVCEKEKPAVAAPRE